MNPNSRSCLLIALISLFHPVADCGATTVKILSSTRVGGISGADGDDDLNMFYQSKGYSSSMITGLVSKSNLSNVDLFVCMLPDDSYSVSEISALSNFLATGGRILFMGEQNTFAPTENTSINTALADLGSSMSLGTSSIDSGFHNAGAAQILENPFNTGVNLVNYGNVNSISGIPAGNELFLTQDLSAAWCGHESVGGGAIILLADTNLISNIEHSAANDNHHFFSNVAGPPGTTFISIARIDADTLEVVYSGVLQHTGDLVDWADISPQPISPWRFSPSGARMFFGRGLSGCLRGVHSTDQSSFLCSLWPISSLGNLPRESRDRKSVNRAFTECPIIV